MNATTAACPLTAPFNTRDFRNALGTFPTGITVVTARSAAGASVGVTCSSFNTVSLSPPMILWSLAETAASLPIFRDASHFAVNVLAEDQEDLSRRFSTYGTDKFDGVAHRIGPSGAPLLDGVAATIECRNAFLYYGGDHTIFLGEVVSYTYCERPALVFYRGQYARVYPLG